MIELENESLKASFIPLGARLVSLRASGRDGTQADVVSGAGNERDFRSGDIYAGAVCGRTAGRINRATFPLDGCTVRLTPTDGGDQLHGGPQGFHLAQWNATQKDNSITFSLHSPDGDQGFPGALDVLATYALEGATLSLEFEARASATTVINLTNHTYWNLAGQGSGLDHEVQIDADHYLPLNERKLPTGDISPVAGSRWDFRKPRRVAEPFDTCFALRGERGKLKRACLMRDPVSGRVMQVFTTEPGLQFYTADHWSSAMPGKGGRLAQHCSIAIEPQNFPDAPNHPAFPRADLRPGDVYRHRMEWRFSTG